MGMNGPFKYLSAAPFGINLRRLVGWYPTLLFRVPWETPRMVVVVVGVPPHALRYRNRDDKIRKVKSRHYRRMETRMMGGSKYTLPLISSSAV